MTLLKDILIKQAGVLGNLESGLPAGAPKVSQLMSNIATTLPVNLDLPKLPIAPGTGFQVPGTLHNLIQGVEDSIPSDGSRGVVPVSSLTDIPSDSLKGQILS